MVRTTMEVPDDLAERIRPLSLWLPTVLELSLSGFQTLAAATAAEVIRFLMTQPSSQDILAYHVSEQAQTRLRRLLSLNESGLLGEQEQQELDELQRIEHITLMLKAQAAARVSSER